MSLMYTYNCIAKLRCKLFVYVLLLRHELKLISMIANLAFTIKTSLMMNFHMWKHHKWVKSMCENSLILYWKVVLQENQSHKRIIDWNHSLKYVCKSSFSEAQRHFWFNMEASYLLFYLYLWIQLWTLVYDTILAAID